MFGRSSKSRATLLDSVLTLAKTPPASGEGAVVAPSAIEAAVAAGGVFSSKRAKQHRSAWRLRREADSLVSQVHSRGGTPEAMLLLQCAIGPMLRPKTAKALDDARAKAVTQNFGAAEPNLAQTQQALATYLAGVGSLVTREASPLDGFARALEAALQAHERGVSHSLYDLLCSHMDKPLGPGKNNADLTGILLHCVRTDLNAQGGLDRLIAGVLASRQPNKWSVLGMAAVRHDSSALMTRLIAAGMPLNTTVHGSDTPLISAAIAGEKVRAVAALFAAGADKLPDKSGEPLTLACSRAIAASKSTRLQAAQSDPASILGDEVGPWRLTAGQRRALDTVARSAEPHSALASKKLVGKLEALGYGPADASRLRTYLAKEADLNINFRVNLAEQYATSDQYLSTPDLIVKKGEHLMFRGAYWNESEYIKYSTLNGTKSRRGFDAFGSGMLVLKDHVRDRATVRLYETTSLLDTQRRLGRVGTLNHFDHVLCEMDEKSLKQLVTASRGEKLARPWRPSSQLETHVHGPIDFSRDIKKLVVWREDLFGGVSGQRRYSSAEITNATGNFSRAHGVPVRLRGSIQSPVGFRERTLQRRKALGWDVAAWTMNDAIRDPHGWQSQGRADVFQFSRSNEAEHPHFTYSTQEQFYQAESGIPAFPPGARVVGYHADSRTGTAQFMLRHTPGDTSRPAYTLEKTTALQATLRKLTLAGQQVVAYAQTNVPGTSTPEHVLIAEANTSTSIRFEHRTRSAGVREVDNLVAAQKKEGFALCGMAAESDGGYSCVFKRPTEDGAQAPSWNMDAARLERIQERSPFTALGDPITSVSEEMLFVTSSDHAFDINELAEFIVNTTGGQFKNWWTQGDLSPRDVEAFLLHPSGAGQRVMNLHMQSDAAKKNISAETGRRIGQASQVMLRADASNDAPDALLAAANLSAYIDTLSSQEKIALHAAYFEVCDTHAGNARSHETVMGALARLQNQSEASCFHKPADFLRQMSQALS